VAVLDDDDAATTRANEHDYAGETSFHQGEFLVDQDGNPIPLEGYDDDDEPSQSGWMHAGDEMETHTADAMHFIARNARTDKRGGLQGHPRMVGLQ
jgi:hypothetical protein